MEGKERVKAALAGQTAVPPCRGEPWLGSEVLAACHLPDSVEGHIRLAAELGMDALFLPVAPVAPSPSPYCYRYFQISEVAPFVRGLPFFSGLVVDGPFQRLVHRGGLRPLLARAKARPQLFRVELEREGEEVERLLAQCLELNVDVLVLAEDLAYQRSTYLSPRDLRECLLPLHARLCHRIHRGAALAWVHSEGNITGLVPDLVAAGWDGLFGCDESALDVLSLKQQWGGKLLLLGGVSQELLDSSSASPAQIAAFQAKVRDLSQGGRFILGTSSGLFRAEHLTSIRSIYGMADGARPAS
ncbi:MAG: hypothetical protein HYX99_03770 [Chloroflexi bacterium]|nr:hypothetical protein [Chloroflexota bacterium]